jgi:hypothetical protein
VGRPAWIAANTCSMARESPSARRTFAARSPSASRTAACFSASARRMHACRSPSAVRISDCFSASAARTVARLSRSARICFSIACWIDDGGSIDFSSMRVTLIPHRSVASSRTMRSSALTVSREVKTCSSESDPTMFRSVVMVSCSIACSMLATSYVARTGSTTE